MTHIFIHLRLLAPCDIKLCSDWLCVYFGFDFMTLDRKALYTVSFFFYIYTLTNILTYFVTLYQVTGSMAGVVKSMDSALKSMNLEKVGHFIKIISCAILSFDKTTS